MRKGLPAKLALTDADDTRYDFKNIVTSNADGSPRGGLVAPVFSNLVTGNASMNVTVGAFAAVAIRDGGCVLLANDGPVNVLIGAAPVSNSRIDLIVARQNDASATVSSPDANNTPILYVVAGTAAPVPSAPALPAGSVEVGRITVAAGNTTTNAMVISQTTEYTVAPGADVPFRTATALLAWSNARNGQQAFALDENATYLRVAGAWKLWDRAAYAFTPALANLNPGATGTNQAWVTVSNGWAKVRGIIILGGAGLAVGSSPTISIPFSAIPLGGVSATAATPLGLASFVDNGSRSHPGSMALSSGSTTTVTPQVWSTSLAQVSSGAVTAAAPFTWVAGDQLQYQYEFEIA